jgi:hypothetical protein
VHQYGKNSVGRKLRATSTSIKIGATEGETTDKVTNWHMVFVMATQQAIVDGFEPIVCLY